MEFRVKSAVAVYVVAVLFVIPPAHGASVPPAENKQKPQEPGQKQIEHSASKTSNTRRARALKSTADFNFERNNRELAANLYLRALALAPDAFSVDEKKQIAERLAAAGRQREAIEMLRQLAHERDDVEIRVHLSKLLSSEENYDEAIAEIDKALKQDRGNKYALLTKSNFLRSQQKFGESVTLYRKILERGEDFDARLGLTYGLLAMGEKTRARDSFARLKPDDDDQRQQTDELKHYLDSVTRPTIDVYNGTLTDSDKNRTTERRFTLRGTGTDWDLTTSYGEKSALSEGVTYKANYVTAGAKANFSEVLRLALKVGQSKLDADRTRTFTTNEISADLKVGVSPLRVVTVNVSHDVVADSGSQIANMIEQDQSGIRFTRVFDANTTLFINYRYMQYSDSNSATDFQGSIQYTLFRGAPFIRVGYMYRNMDYRRPAFNGYFDPQDYSSHQAFVTLYYENTWLVSDFEVDYGRQKYERNFVDSDDKFIYASATLGTTSSKKLRLELHAEYNQSKSNNTSLVYDDLLVSSQLSYMF